ncbi:uncharacterized protein LOC134530416 isoform X2 [Bacillus rossius redtenbacheri]
MSAPLDRGQPLWVNPCGVVVAVNPGGGSEFTEFTTPVVKDEELLTQIVGQARTALGHAETFRDKYVESTFKLKLQDHHTAWRSNQYDWLPGPEQIPKSLGETLDPEYLQTVQFEQALKDSYEYLQKYAVGLEQVVSDQYDHNGAFLSEFKDAEYNVRSTLCEIQLGMMAKNVTQKPDVARDIMADEYRSMGNSSYRNLRDWLIFRDYMNGLEYVVQVFEYVRDHLAAS